MESEHATPDALTRPLEAAPVQRSEGSAERDLAMAPTPSLPQRRRELLEQFYVSASDAFLGAYRDTILDTVNGSTSTSGAAPAVARDAVLLDLALLEKAAYEVCYEAAHRPDWLPIPLAGLARIGSRMLTKSGTPDKEPSDEQN